MTNKTDKCIGSLLSLIGYNPQVFSELKNTNKIIKIHKKHPFNGLYENYVSLQKRLNDSERKDVRDYFDPDTNPLIYKLSNENNNTDNLTKLVAIINLIVNHVPKLKHDYFEELKQREKKNTLQAFEIQNLERNDSKSYACINKFVTEFNCLYKSLRLNECQEFFNKMSVLWETIQLENFDDRMTFEEFKKIIPFKDFKGDMPAENFDDDIGELLKFDSNTPQVKIQFSEYFSGCEKIVTLRKGKRRRLFRIQIDAFDENLNKEVDGYIFHIIVDQNDRWDLENDNKNLILYFEEKEKNGSTFVLPTGTVVVNSYFDNGTKSKGNYGKEGEECTILFKKKDEQPKTYHVNERRKTKK